jgi:beta-galactosidase
MKQSRRATGFLAATLLFLAGIASAEVVDFDFDWCFSRGDFATAMMPAFDDSAWQTLDVPHDWSAEGPFLAEYGSGNGYAPGGIGWYRKHFTLDAADRGKRVVIEFDGVYHNSEAWINGHFVGRRPCGYSSFHYDLTRHVRFGQRENVVAVRVDHTKFADSRWYTGSGIYRHVRLHVTDKLHVGLWGVYVTTPEVKNDSATIRIETVVRNDHGEARTFSLESSVVAPDGKVAAALTLSGTLDANAEQTLVPQIKIADPQLWSTESPHLYTLRSVLKAGDEIVQEVATPFGIRTIAFDPDKGFFLNGRAMKLKGVCLHHDAGCLGAAVPDKVLERRLRLMKDLGANAIRTSHNPPAPELLDLCDRLGLLVKDEMFDEFTPPKNKWVEGWNAGQPSKFGYGEVFAEWSVRDMEDLVRRDRNHPCVIMWSIGNEIDYPNDPFSHPALGNNYRPDHPPAEDLVKHARPLIEAVKRWDGTRPVTAALASITMSNAVGLAQLLDVVGYNYQEQHYEADHRTYPDRFIFGSENGDSYGAWAAVRDNDYVAGQFLWTGIDYLGEARRWPNRANGAGLLDMCGFKKPIGWFRQSLWSDEPMVYICASTRGARRGPGMGGAEHWNWPEDARVTVSGYTNCEEVVLTLDGETLGTKRLSEAREGVLTWEVPFKAGVLKAIGRNGGRDVCEFVLKTAGPAARITLSPDMTHLSADGRDVYHVEFSVVDEQGVRVPDAEHEITFDVNGSGRIIGIENGDLNSLDDPKDNVHKAYRGRGLAILQAAREPGTVRVTARAEGLNDAAIEIDAGQVRR